MQYLKQKQTLDELPTPSATNLRSVPCRLPRMQWCMRTDGVEYLISLCVSGPSTLRESPKPEVQ